MKVTHLVVREPTQHKYGSIRQTLTDKDGFDMTYLSRAGIVEIDHKNWHERANYTGPIALPVPQLASFQTERG